MLSGWSYDLYAQWSRSKASYETDFIYDDRIKATTENFALPCDPALIIKSGPVANCPTILWTSASIINGQFSPEQAAFLFGHETGTTVYDQTLVNGIITGDMATLPAGAVSAAIGFELRRTKSTTRPVPMPSLTTIRA